MVVCHSLAMAAPNDGAKGLLPFLQRADEMARHDKRVAYYCASPAASCAVLSKTHPHTTCAGRLYALEQGLALPDRSAETNALLGSLLKQLEVRLHNSWAWWALRRSQRVVSAHHQVDKPSAGLADDDALYMEGFAARIFNKADALDRSGRSDAATAKALYASSLFFEVLRQFGELAPETAAKQKYAAWRAAEIRAAVKEGRAPVAAPSAAAADGPIHPPPVVDAPFASGYATPPSMPSTPPPAASGGQGSAAFSPRMETGRPSLAPTPSPPPGLKAPVLTDLPGTPSASGLPLNALMEAQAAAKIAASALSFDDVPTAVTQLRIALHALRAS